MGWQSILASVLVVSTALGCAKGPHRGNGGSIAEAVGPSDRLADAVPGSRRGPLLPRVANLGVRGMISEDDPIPTPPAEYRRVSEKECQCRAAAAAGLAGVMDEESGLAGAIRKRRRNAETSLLKRDLLTLAARDERNRAAASALEVFFRLAEAEANRDLLTRSLRHVETSLSYVRQMRDRGLKVEFSDASLHLRRRELLDQQRELHHGIQQLGGRLVEMLGLEPNDPRPIWPVTELRVDTTPIDADAAVAVGLDRRADIAALQLMDARLTAGNLSTVRAALSKLNTLLGSGGTRTGVFQRLFHDPDLDDEIAVRRRQIRQLLASRRREAAVEIRGSVGRVEMRMHQTRLAAAGWQRSQKRAGDLLRKRSLGDVTAFDVSAARLEAEKAESELVGKIVAWKIAVVRLREAQGVLAIECGYGSNDSHTSGGSAGGSAGNAGAIHAPCDPCVLLPLGTTGRDALAPIDERVFPDVAD